MINQIYHLKSSWALIDTKIAQKSPRAMNMTIPIFQRIDFLNKTQQSAKLCEASVSMFIGPVVDFFTCDVCWVVVCCCTISDVC